MVQPRAVAESRRCSKDVNIWYRQAICIGSEERCKVAQHTHWKRIPSKRRVCHEALNLNLCSQDLVFLSLRSMCEKCIHSIKKKHFKAHRFLFYFNSVPICFTQMYTIIDYNVCPILNLFSILVPNMLYRMEMRWRKSVSWMRVMDKDVRSTEHLAQHHCMIIIIW